MISTITTTVTTIATMSIGATLGALTTFLLISLLSTKELATADARHTLRTLGRSLNVSIFPILIVFSIIVVFEAMNVLI